MSIDMQEAYKQTNKKDANRNTKNLSSSIQNLDSSYWLNAFIPSYNNHNNNITVYEYIQS